MGDGCAPSSALGPLLFQGTMVQVFYSSPTGYLTVAPTPPMQVWLRTGHEEGEGPLRLALWPSPPFLCGSCSLKDSQENSLERKELFIPDTGDPLRHPEGHFFKAYLT